MQWMIQKYFRCDRQWRSHVLNLRCTNRHETEIGVDDAIAAGKKGENSSEIRTNRHQYPLRHLPGNRMMIEDEYSTPDFQCLKTTQHGAKNP
jgi:hypothetical protein